MLKQQMQINTAKQHEQHNSNKNNNNEDAAKRRNGTTHLGEGQLVVAE